MSAIDSLDKLILYIGPMFSGKTTENRKELSRFKSLNLNVLFIGHGSDDRTTGTFSTHSCIMQGDAGFDEIKAKDLLMGDNPLITCEGDWNKFKKYEAIGIDEAQFFNYDLIPFVTYLVETLEKFVVVSGLDGSNERNPIGHILSLIPIADKVVKLRAFCASCIRTNPKRLTAAPFTYRKASLGHGTIIGGADIYTPVCRRCWIDLTRKDEEKELDEIDKTTE